MLTPGQRLGPYEVLATLGAGGMGHVYRARDTRLNRDVALKLIVDSFALDDERVARCRREAQVLASLNHAHIGAIFGLEEADGRTALVLELVDGPTLADRIAEGPLPVAEALTMARQIAEALQAAHEQGILHRDLKPANIKLRPDGTVKVLDFGLAKMMTSEAASVPSGTASMSPTLTTPAMTGVGVILGTAAYMAPEQAKGKPLDKRADIWAFGCVFYEILTGRRAFDGEDVGDTLAAVLRGEPDWRSLPKGLRPAHRALLEGCLTKDRTDRIGDFSTVLFLVHKAPGLLDPRPASRSRSMAPRTLRRRPCRRTRGKRHDRCTHMAAKRILVVRARSRVIGQRRRRHVCRTVSTDRHQAPNWSRRPAALVTRPQRAVPRALTG